MATTTAPLNIVGLPTNFVIPSTAGLDLSRHDSIAATLIRVNAAFIGITATMLAIRLYVRAVIVRKVGVDDYLMLAAVVATITLSIMAILGTKHGMGKHVWDLPLEQAVTDAMIIVKYLFVAQIAYATGMTLTKFSIMTSYLRIFPNEIFRKLLYITGAFCIAIWVCSVVVTIFQCSPVRGAWEFTLENKKCIHILRFFYVTASFNIATDLLLCTLPLPQFWKLNLPLKERTIVCVLFGFGFFATIASVFRLTQLHNLGEIDVTYTCVSSLNWSVVEVGTAIVCASIPSIKPLISKLLPGRIFTSRHNRSAPQSAISGPYDLKHLSGVGGYGVGLDSRHSRIGLDSRHSRMSLAKTGTVTRVYSSGMGSDEADSLDSLENDIGVAVSTTNMPPLRRLSQVKVTHNIQVVSN